MNNKLNNKVINELTSALAKSNEENIFVDILLFENDDAKKIKILKKIIDIKEISQNDNLNSTWRAILSNYIDYIQQLKENGENNSNE